ncbi:MAG: glycoside hydrolase family 31 protein [Acidimicrobiales bacterium]
MGIRCVFAEAELELRFLDDDVVRLTWGPGELPLPWALASDPEVRGPKRPLSIHHGDPGGGCRLSGSNLTIEVDSGGHVRFWDSAGALLRHELPPLRRGSTVTSRQVLRPGERLSGLGEQASPVDLRGSTHRLWNRDPGGAWGPGQDPLYCGIPVLVGLHPDGNVLAFHENTYEAVVKIGGGDAGTGLPAQVDVAFAGGTLRHYVATGSLPNVLDSYSQLTGRPPIPPRWALGYHQCKWGYRSEADIHEVAAGFAADGVPLSAVHLDIDYMDGYRVFSVDPARFPDLKRLADELKLRGTHLVSIVDPAVKADPSYGVYADGVEHGHFLLDDDGNPRLGVVWPGRAAFPDFTDPRTRKWWSGWYRHLLASGVSGIWHDMNEPTSITLWGDRTIPQGTRHAAEGRGGDHRECHNVYGHLMNQAGWEAMSEFDEDRRPFVLSRSGWAGLQRWAWNWTGDIESSWDGLRQQIATAIGLGLSGVAYTGSDIGGFSGIPDAELYLRWLEMSVFMPFCRTHSVLGSPNREPWRFDEPFRSAIDRLIRFRYRILPYLYTLAHHAHVTGHPLVRPLCWPDHNGGASLTWPVDDAYFLGDALLVAPVTVAGGRSRQIPLPRGRWYHWRALPEFPGPGEDPSGPGDRVMVVEGGRTVTLDAPAGQPVVLVREGTILPLDDGWDGAGMDDGRLTTGHRPRLTAWHCFPDSNGNAVGTGYDDAGDGAGSSRVDRLCQSGDPAGLEWEHDGGYGLPASVRVVVHGSSAPLAWADGNEAATSVSESGQLPRTVVEAPAFRRLQLGPLR